MLLHVHKDLVDSLDLNCVGNDFVADSEHTLNIDLKCLVNFKMISVKHYC